MSLERVYDIEEIAGHGVKAVVDGKTVYAGNLRLMNKIGISVSREYDDGTMVYVAVDNNYAGCIMISDVIKETSKDAISGLKKHGIKQTVMLTGDAKKTAEKVAKEIGMDKVCSELLPADKVNEVEKLLDQKNAKEKLAICRRRNQRCIRFFPVQILVSRWEPWVPMRRSKQRISF